MELINDSSLMLQVIKLCCIAGLAVATLAFVCLLAHLHKEKPFVKHKKEEWEIAFERWLHRHHEKSPGMHRGI